MRNVREHRIARTAHGFELGLVAQHLHLQALRRRRARNDDAALPARSRLHLLERVRRADAASLQDRARVVARPSALRVAHGFQNVAAKAADRLRRRHLEQPLRLRIEEADAPRIVDRVDAFDDPTEHCLRFSLAAPQLGR